MLSMNEHTFVPFLTNFVPESHLAIALDSQKHTEHEIKKLFEKVCRKVELINLKIHLKSTKH